MIAGRVLLATRALPRRPRTENFIIRTVKHWLELKFPPRGRSPKLHSGPSTQRVVPYQNDAHNQQPQEDTATQG